MNYPVLFIEAFRNSLEANADRDSALGLFIEALQDVTPVLTGRVMDDLKHPLLSQLDDALKAAFGPPELVDSVAALSSAGGWYQVYTGDGINAAMSDFMLAKQIVGPKGLFAKRARLNRTANKTMCGHGDPIFSASGGRVPASTMPRRMHKRIQY